MDSDDDDFDPDEVKDLISTIVAEKRSGKAEVAAKALGMNTDQVPDTVGGDLIGEGPRGEVHRAWCEARQSFVALKEIPSDGELHGYIDEIKQGMQLASSGKSSHSVTVYGFTHDHRELRLSMELLRESVADAVRDRGPLPETECIRIVNQALLGLQRVHWHGLVHRNIKPSNLLIAEDGTVKLTDLGVVRDLEPEAKRHRSTDAPRFGYFAPEAVVGGQRSPAVDVWSLGCTWIHMATGNEPWDGVIESDSNPFVLLRELRTRKDAVPVIPHHMSEGAQGVLRRMLCRDPRLRATVDELIVECELLQDRPSDDDDLRPLDFHAKSERHCAR